MADQPQPSTPTKKPAIVGEIQKRVNIVGVRLFHARSELFVALAAPPPEWALDMTAKTGGRKSPARGGYIQVVAGLEVVARPKNQPKAPPVARIECEFVLDYAIEDKGFYETLRDEDVVAFGAVNGMYNAWPYARAHVQATAAGMMIPLVL